MTKELRWAIPGRLCMFALPDQNELNDLITKNKLGMIVRLYDEKEAEEKSLDWETPAKTHDCVVRPILTPDFGVPDWKAGMEAKEMKELAELAIETWNSGKTVGIHCGAGKGRTGTIAAALLATCVYRAGSWPERPLQKGFVCAIVNSLDKSP